MIGVAHLTASIVLGSADIYGPFSMIIAIKNDIEDTAAFDPVEDGLADLRII
jgi:hypothetical protein